MSHPNADAVRARLALLPGLIGAIVLVAALALIGGDWYIWVRFVVAILALIVCVFAYQAKSYWWLIGLVPVAIVFNPVWPLTFGDLWLRLLHLGGAVVFIAAGIAIKVPVDEGRRGPEGRYDGRRRRPQSGSRPSDRRRR